MSNRPLVEGWRSRLIRITTEQIFDALKSHDLLCYPEEAKQIIRMHLDDMAEEIENELGSDGR